MVIKPRNIILLLLIAFLSIFSTQAHARQFEPGDFVDGTTHGTGDVGVVLFLKWRGDPNDEVRFIDVETARTIYSKIFDNSEWLSPIIGFSPDGKTVELLWQPQPAYRERGNKIELIDIYNNRLIKRYEFRNTDLWNVRYSRCSNFSCVIIYFSNIIGDAWNISYEFVDLKTPSDTLIKTGSLSSKCAPPDAYITQNARNIGFRTCDKGDVVVSPLPDPSITIPNDPDPVMPPVTVIPEGILDSAKAAKFLRGLTSLATQVLSSLVQPSTFPIIKFAVRVIGQDKRPITGLTAGNFQVKEDGVNQLPLTVELQGSDVPVSIALCLDTSGSINDNELRQINAAASKFIDLFGGSDRGAVFKFSTNVQLIQGFTPDKGSLKSAINSGPPERNLTSLYDAIYEAISLSRGETNRKAIVALTDGYDNDSSHTLSQVVSYSLENRIPVFTLGLGNPLNVSLLQKLANDCHGIYFNAAKVDKLEEAFNKIAEDIRSRYVITYTTSNPKKDGTIRTVEAVVRTGGNSASGTLQYRAPQGIKPTAQIVSISPNPASTGQDVTFKGIGVGGTIVEYSWRSSIDGVIGNQETFTTRSLSEDQHTIYFKVKNSDDLWSDEVSSSLTVTSTRKIFGHIQYDNRPYNETGSGPDVVELKPVRLADFEIVHASDNAVLASGETNADGAYEATFNVRHNEEIILKCYAHQENSNYNIKVINSHGDKHVATSENKQVTDSEIAINLEITEAMGAGAFNILDTLMQGSDKVRELSNSVPPLITVSWEKGIGSSTGFDRNTDTIYISGADPNPDEYDDTTILHEYGHFISSKYSYDKSPGVSHRLDDMNQDIRLSWSEGWATFFACMVRNNSMEINIMQDNYRSFYNIEDLDFDSPITGYISLTSTAKGQDTEVTVSSLLWDIYDSANDRADALSLGAQPIWDVFRSFNSSYDCVLEDFYNLFFSNPANEVYRSQINNIFAERKVFYSTPLFKRGKIFTKSDGRDIPNGGGQSLSSILSITDNLSILNLNVFVDITHGYKSDLLIKLISPSSKEVILHNHTSPQSGQSQDIFAWYQPPYETIPDGNRPGIGQDLTALDIFKADSTKGEWILRVEDLTNQFMLDEDINGDGIPDIDIDRGTLNRWKLEILENQPPELDPIGDKIVNEGKLLEFNISAKDPNNQELTYSVTGIPQGAYFSPEKRLFSWLPNYNQQGEYTVHFEVSDGSLKDSEDIKIIVNDVTIKPISGESVGIGLKVRVIQ